MWVLPCSVAQHHLRWVSPVIMSHQCLTKHTISAYHLPCRAQFQQGLGDHWRLLVVGCHDRRIQSVHSPLAGILQYCPPHLCHDAQTCTELKHNQIHCMISTHMHAKMPVIAHAHGIGHCWLFNCWQSQFCSVPGTHTDCRTCIALLHINPIDSIPVSVFSSPMYMQSQSAQAC